MTLNRQIVLRARPRGEPGPDDFELIERQDFVAGLERSPRALIDLLAGRHFGKVVVRVAEPCPRLEGEIACHAMLAP